MNPCIYSRGATAKNSGPLYYWPRLTIGGDYVISSRVGGLLSFGSPSAIIGLVVTVIVFAVNGMLLAGPRPHIGIEVLERRQPAVANADSTPAVIGKARILLVEAPYFHICPCLIFRKPTHSVRCEIAGVDFFRQASATQALSHSQGIAANSSLCPAFAATEPSQRAVLGLTGEANNRPAVKFESGKVFAAWWLGTRPCSRAVQIGPPGMPGIIEFYVPWWAWPLELIHRAVFGYPRLTAIKAQPDWPDQLELECTEGE